MTSSQTITRFAPSPTGHLHIGGARTALLCWAFAKKAGGRFMLRIEDTDQQRSSESSTRGILEDLAWLGIDWDDGPALDYRGKSLGGDSRNVGPYYQSQRLGIYEDAINKLIEEDKAYPAFETPDELEAKRKEAIAAKQGYKYDRAALDIPRDERMARMKTDDYVVRFKMPDEPITVHDEILGDVTIKPEEFDDFIIRKRDGFPTYHLAVTVDDALMGVTHVLRGQEHLINTPRHVALQSALGYPHPVYGHMPLIFNPNQSKMSKRDKQKVLRGAVTAYLETHHPEIDISESCKLLATRMEVAGLLQGEKPAASTTSYPFEKEYYARMVAKEIQPAGSYEQMLLQIKGIESPQGVWGYSNIPVYKPYFDRAKEEILDILEKMSGEEFVIGVAAQQELLQEWFASSKSSIDHSYVRDMAEMYNVKLPEIDVEDFRRAGYLPGALNNYLALLGWNPKSKNEDGTDLERFDMDYLASNFTMGAMSKGQSKFDRVKLLSFNADAIAVLSDEDFARLWHQWASAYDKPLAKRFSDSDMLMLAPAVKTRCKTLADGRSVISFAFVDDDAIEYDGKAVHKALIKGESKGLELLKAFREHLNGVEEFTPTSIETMVAEFAESQGAGMGKLAQPIRVAVTGAGVSPPLGQTLAILGKNAVMARIDHCIEHASAEKV